MTNTALLHGYGRKRGLTLLLLELPCGLHTNCCQQQPAAAPNHPLFVHQRPRTAVLNNVNRCRSQQMFEEYRHVQDPYSRLACTL